MHRPVPALTRFRASRLARWATLAAALVILLPLLAACGGGDKNDDPSAGSQIQWQAGLPPQQGQPAAATSADAGQAAQAPQPTVEQQQPAEAPTQPPAEPTAAATAPPAATQAAQAPAGSDHVLTAEELAQYKPNEVGKILVLEYHQFTTDPKQEAQFVRPIEKFQGDLQWLYDHGFYVVKLKDVITDAISAPAGKHPVVLTFDDSTAGQFRYLPDGSIDPNSAMGVMEAFYAAHPDFGRGGFFGVLPHACFDWNGDQAEPDQTQFCKQKLDFLLANGYEVGNHTLDHKSIQDISDEGFLEQLGGAIEALQQYNPNIEADIFVVPFGMYPDRDKHQQQREWMRDGFEYNGKSYKLLGSLMVGSEPADSPVSTAWDSMWIARIQVCDCTDKDGKPAGGWEDTWQQFAADNPSILYTSDGNPNTVTVPNQLPSSLDGTFDEAKAEADGKQVIRY